MLSDEKIVHLVHLALEGIKKQGLVSYPDQDAAIREGKKVCMQFMSQLTACAERAKARIESMKNAPPEHSQQWKNLYLKYYEEELRRAGS